MSLADARLLTRVAIARVCFFSADMATEAQSNTAEAVGSIHLGLHVNGTAADLHQVQAAADITSRSFAPGLKCASTPMSDRGRILLGSREHEMLCRELLCFASASTECLLFRCPLNHLLWSAADYVT